MAAPDSDPDPHHHPIRPMLPSDGDPPAGSAWAFEFEWDGLRAIAYARPERTHLLSGGSERLITAGYPELSALTALAQARGELVLDGKIVAFDEVGRPSAGPLRKRMSTPSPSTALVRKVPVRFYASDLLHVDGRSCVALPYRRRRELLAELDLAGVPVELSPYFLDIDGRTMLEVAQQHGLAGVLAKRLDSRYQPGRRSRAWVRTPSRQTQRVVVGGWRPGGSGGAPGGALLVGLPEPGGLRYVGRVSAGLDQRGRRALAGRIDDLVRRDCPFREPPPERHAQGVRWVTPRLVGEVAYRQWGPDGRLQHASWVGLCPDEHPTTVRAPATAAPRRGAATPGAPERTASGPAGGPDDRPGGDPDRELVALQEAVRLAQAEVRALRAQISPHFVYNALTTIAASVRTDPPRARELLAEFAEYTRYSFRAAVTSTSLGAELDNVERYLALEQARFADRLRIVCRVDDELRAVRMPFLTLQPLVEHAVRHGIEGTPHGGTLRISAKADGSECAVTVSEDASRGEELERLDEVAGDVRARLVAAGHRPGLEVHADAGGTSVTMRVRRGGGADR